MKDEIYTMMNHHNSNLSEYAWKDEEAIYLEPINQDIRTPYFRDIDRIISVSYTHLDVYKRQAYESYNLYTGSLGASESKTYHLKIWVDYDATIEQAANKVYSSKINVIANPETTIVDTLEAQFSLNEKTMTGTLSLSLIHI